MQIVEGNLNDPRVIALLDVHVAASRAGVIQAFERTQPSVAEQTIFRRGRDMSEGQAFREPLRRTRAPSSASARASSTGVADPEAASFRVRAA